MEKHKNLIFTNLCFKIRKKNILFPILSNLNNDILWLNHDQNIQSYLLF